MCQILTLEARPTQPLTSIWYKLWEHLMSVIWTLIMGIYSSITFILLNSLLSSVFQRADAITYLLVNYITSLISLCTTLAVYNLVKSLLRLSAYLCWVRKNLELTEGLEYFKLYFDFQANTCRISHSS